MDSCRDRSHLLRQDVNSNKQNVGRNMDIKGHSGEVSEILVKKHRNEEPIIGDLCYKVAENLAGLFCGI